MFVFVVWILNVRSILTHFEVNTMALLTAGTVLYSTSLELVGLA